MDAIVFDWDGTLVDTLPAMLDANAQVLEEYGLPFDHARYRAAYIPDWRVMYQRLGVPDSAIEAAGARWLELYSAIATLQPFAGAESALRRLSAAGHVMGIVTAGDRPVVEDQLERFGLGKLLPIRVCGDDDIAAKRRGLGHHNCLGHPRAPRLWNIDQAAEVAFPGRENTSIGEPGVAVFWAASARAAAAS